MSGALPLAATQRLAAALEALPLVAILRGVGSSEAPGVGAALYEAGFRVIEVPLNSPDPLASIASLRAGLPPDAVVGAGTVLTARDVALVRAAGGELVVMPHSDAAVIQRARSLGLACVPGVATPTEAFAALAAGADALKLFPAELVTPAVVKTIRAVLPREVTLLPVGGITPERMQAYRDAGAAGFGLGSALYTPGMTLTQVSLNAGRFLQAWRGVPAA